MENQPLISVVTVCYNAATTIEKTILSVLNQSYSKVEYIIIDGRSTDGTVDIIKKYADRLAYWVSEPDEGIYDAMNKGIAIATGEYINFMNSGDYFVNNYVLADIAESARGKCVDVIFGDVVYLIDGDYYEVKARPFYSDPSVKHSMGFCHQSCFVKTDLAKHFPFDLRYKLAADYNMIITIFRNNGVFNHVNIPVAFYDMNGASNQERLQHETEIFFIDRPQSPIANYVEVRIRAITRYIKRYTKCVLLKVAPELIKLKRTVDNKKKVCI